MIQPLRRTHYWIWMILTVVIFAVFLAGLMARRPAPTNNGLNWGQYR